MSSGLFNTFFAMGNLTSPIVGNYLYVNIGFEDTCEYIGITMIAFGIAYFLGCDDLFFKTRSKEHQLILEMV
jgi:hypothetical protein